MDEERDDIKYVIIEWRDFDPTLKRVGRIIKTYDEIEEEYGDG